MSKATTIQYLRVGQANHDPEFDLAEGSRQMVKLYYILFEMILKKRDQDRKRKYNNLYILTVTYILQ